MAAVIDRALSDQQFHPVVALPSGLANPVQLLPHLIGLRVSVNLEVTQVPAFLAWSPAPERDHQSLADTAAAALHVHAGRDHQHAIGHGAHRVAVAGFGVLSSLGQALDVELILDLIAPCFRRALVDPALEQ